MKLKLILTFVISYIIILAIFNSQFLYSYIRYTFQYTTDTAHASEARLLPIAQNKTATPLTSVATLTISKLNISAPIIFNTGENITTIFNSLTDGVVHYSKTPKPGEQGVSIILGHSSMYPWYKGNYGTVFALINKLNVGDTFSVRYNDGRIFTYSVKKSFVFNASDTSAITQNTDISNGIILVTCWPIGTNYKRLAVEAVLLP